MKFCWFVLFLQGAIDEIIVYKGDRSEGDLIKFVKTHASKKARDEL